MLLTNHKVDDTVCLRHHRQSISVSCCKPSAWPTVKLPSLGLPWTYQPGGRDPISTYHESLYTVLVLGQLINTCQSTSPCCWPLAEKLSSAHEEILIWDCCEKHIEDKCKDLSSKVMQGKILTAHTTSHAHTKLYSLTPACMIPLCGGALYQCWLLSDRQLPLVQLMGNEG